MGNPVVDYFFNSDPFDLNFRLLVLNGFWPLETKKGWLQALYSIFSFICLFSIISMLFIQILDLYLLRNDMYTFTKNLCATSVTFLAIVKHLLVFFKIDDVLRLHRSLCNYKNSLTNAEYVEIFEEAARTMTKTTKATYGLALPCIAAWMLYPGLESSKTRSVPFPYRLPTDDWSTPIYEILYTYQSLSMIGFMVIVLSTDLIYYGFVILINAKYEILINKIKKVEEAAGEDLTEVGGGLPYGCYDPAVTKKVKTMVKDCSVYHQNILGDIDELKVLYGNIYVVHFFGAVVLVGAIIVDVVVVSKGFKLQMLQRIMYSLNGVFDTFLCCFFTTLMQEKSYKVGRTVYSTPWYRLDPKVRKDLLMISTRSIKASAVRVGNYFPLNLSTFLQFLNISYNTTALLYQTIKK